MAEMIGFSVEKSTFLSKAEIARKLNKANDKALRQSGATVRAYARNLIKFGRKRKYKDLRDYTKEEKKKLFKALGHWKKHGKQEDDHPRKTGELLEAKPKIRKAKRGKPPFYHRGVIRQIYYAVEGGGSDAIVGPALEPNVSGKDVPKALEYGGRSRDRWGRILNIEPHPFMRPALEKSHDRIAEFWENSFH